MKKVIAKLFWFFNRWKLVREPERVSGPRILIGAPHTSNYDFLLMLAIAWDAGLRVHWLGKKELFKGVMGPIMRALGGIPVDRKNPENVVAGVLEKAATLEDFTLVVTPEGSRSGKGWRSGFYRIARSADMPVTLGFADGSTRSAGLGPTIHLTGNVRQDMDVVRKFYADKTGVRPHLKTEPRFSDEDALTQMLKNG